jgi:cytosine/adenosine deaminase-related metal-dependent hydrolase
VRKIAATYIFPISQPPIKNGILTCADDGTILEIIENNENLQEQQGLEFYSGILVPGFVNAHCHLELSHLKGKISEKTGIGGFIGQINQLRNQETDNRQKAIEVADKRMWHAGIAAVGDISNSTLTLKTKLKSTIFYHSFIESFGFHPDRSERAFELALSVMEDFKINGLMASIVPHSPYSVSTPLFEKIKENAKQENSILTIHNQESASENEFYKTGKGAISKHLSDNLGIDISHWQPTGKNSLESILKFIPEKNQLLLVHNTFTTIEDLKKLKSLRNMDNTYFVLCPNSNLYIENQLPPVTLFRKEKLNICIGTDSLASNHDLSVLQEIFTLQKYFEDIGLEELLNWSCINGARAIGMEKTLGSFDVGKTPGINLITDIDFKTMKLKENSKVKRLV